MKDHEANYGVMREGVNYDLDKMMAQKDKAVVGLTKGVEGLFKKNKVGPAPEPVHDFPRYNQLCC